MKNLCEEIYEDEIYEEIYEELYVRFSSYYFLNIGTVIDFEKLSLKMLVNYLSNIYGLFLFLIFQN